MYTKSSFVKRYQIALFVVIIGLTACSKNSSKDVSEEEIKETIELEESTQQLDSAVEELDSAMKDLEEIGDLLQSVL
ncbi:MAG: hypothetical protein ACI9JN_000635 [Bacteroidia bacterium]|jgi:hypothetical protein